jgi:hypothetical protein
MLHVGDAVAWRGAWGSEAPRRAVVRSIEQTYHPREKYGTQVQEMPWSRVRKNYAVVDLDNGHWAYGEQIYPILQDQDLG